MAARVDNGRFTSISKQNEIAQLHDRSCCEEDLIPPREA